jgi:nudix-type nucleoside diphosphatase (YffH/AdpP family)
VSAVFLHGPLCHAPLLRLVLGGDADTRPAVLPEHGLLDVVGAGHAVLGVDPAAAVSGLLIAAPAPEAYARLLWYLAVFGDKPVSGVVLLGLEKVEATLFTPAAEAAQTAPPWDQDRWLREEADLSLAVAADLMALYPGPVPSPRLMARRVRGASRMRAEAEAVSDRLRRAVLSSDLRVEARKETYANFFAVEEYDMTWRRFDGSFGPVVTRAAFISGDAVTVLPYDPARDRVLLVEQFRVGHFARGDRQPWSLEAIAGRIDPGESPEEAARREAMEEAGLTLTELLPVASYYPTPGAKIEYLYTYVALTGLPDGCAIIGGEESEAEDIRGHLIGFGTLMEMVASGEVDNGPLILTALWLQRERGRLRAGSAAP